jgi:hypothetical protein
MEASILSSAESVSARLTAFLANAQSDVIAEIPGNRFRTYILKGSLPEPLHSDLLLGHRALLELKENWK